MNSTVEYVEVYTDGHEVVHHDFPLTEEISRYIRKCDELTYEQDANSTAVYAPRTLVVTGYSCAPECLHLDSDIKYCRGAVDVRLGDNAYYRLARIVHHVEHPEPPTTGLWLDRENNVVWFDYPHKYYTLIADSGCDYLNGLDYTPKPPFKPLITAMEIINKQEEA